MSRYNAQKRATLDRIAFKHQLKMRQFLNRDLGKQVGDIFSALNAGQDQYAPATVGLSDNIKKKFEDHRGNTIFVGASDAIQEISPENELGLGDRYDYRIPVEETLSVQLQASRKDIISQLLEDVVIRRAPIFAQTISDMTNAHLKNTKSAFGFLSQDWLVGESTISDVKRALGASLKKTDFEAARIFRTETTGYFNLTRHSYFSTETDSEFMQLFVVTDGRISNICNSRANFILTIQEAGIKKNMPPFHPHCRTIQRPLMTSLKRHRAIIDKYKDTVKETDFVPLPKGWA